jgi:hypothetical protein
LACPASQPWIESGGKSNAAAATESGSGGELLRESGKTFLLDLRPPLRTPTRPDSNHVRPPSVQVWA